MEYFLVIAWNIKFYLIQMVEWPRSKQTLDIKFHSYHYWLIVPYYLHTYLLSSTLFTLGI